LAIGQIVINAGGWSAFGTNAFSGCASVTSIALLDTSSNASMFYIDEGMFKDCSRLESVIINGDILGIGANAFENCHNLSYIEFNA
jgi:hypothetical protein